MRGPCVSRVQHEAVSKGVPFRRGLTLTRQAGCTPVRMTQTMTPTRRPGRNLRPRSLGRGKSTAAALAVAAAGMLLASMATSGPAVQRAYAQAADSNIKYAENGTGPVGVFHAYDQDGEAIEWSLDGPDAALFTIDGGVLAFREAPDYEDPRSAGSGNAEARNVYRVTIEANGAAHHVAVTVTDVDEAGVVKIDRPQPQVDRPLEAGLSDDDEGVAVQGWQWARSRDRKTWTDIEGATSRQRSPEPADEGMYLRATVAYADKFGPNKTASTVSANKVEARTLSNAGPSFVDPDGDEVATLERSVTENSAVGSPVADRYRRSTRTTTSCSTSCWTPRTWGMTTAHGSPSTAARVRSGSLGRSARTPVRPKTRTRGP